MLDNINPDFIQDVAGARKAVILVLNIAANVERSGFRAGGPIPTIALETASTNPRLRQTCANIYAGWMAAFTEKLRSGGMRDESAGNMTTLIIAAIEGGVILCRTHQSRHPLEIVADEIRTLIGSIWGL